MHDWLHCMKKDTQGQKTTGKQINTERFNKNNIILEDSLKNNHISMTHHFFSCFQEILLIDTKSTRLDLTRFIQDLSNSINSLLLVIRKQ